MAEQVNIFVINLKRSKERREEITRIMKEYSLSFELIEAVDGDLLSNDFMDEIYKRTPWYKEDWGQNQSMKRGEAGASLSHFKVYQKIINDNIDFAVILEDDAFFDEKFRHVVSNKKKIEELMERFDLLLLGYCGNDVNYHRPAECSYRGRIKIDGIIQACIPVEWCWSAVGYIISLKGTKLLAKKQGEIPCLTADILTANSPKYGVRLGVIKNQIVWPGETSYNTTIHGRITHKELTQIKKDKNKDQKKQPEPSNYIIDVIKSKKKHYRALRSFIKNKKVKLSAKLYQFTSDKY